MGFFRGQNLSRSGQMGFGMSRCPEKRTNGIFKKRGQTLSQMALAWVLRHPTMTSALIGARTIKQLDECLDSLKNLKFSKSELKQIDIFAKEEKINLWEPSSRY